MPAVESGKVMIVLLRDRVSMKGPVVRMFQLDVHQAFVRVNQPVSNDLDLWLVRNGLQVWVEDAPFAVLGFSMAVGGGGRVEALGEGVLGFGGEVELVFDDEDEVFVERVVEGVERGVYRVLLAYSLHVVYGALAVPVRFSRSTFSTTAPKLISEPSGGVKGLIVRAIAIVVERSE